MAGEPDKSGAVDTTARVVPTVSEGVATVLSAMEPNDKPGWVRVSCMSKAPRPFRPYYWNELR